MYCIAMHSAPQLGCLEGTAPYSTRRGGDRIRRSARRHRKPPTLTLTLCVQCGMGFVVLHSVWVLYLYSKYCTAHTDLTVARHGITCWPRDHHCVPHATNSAVHVLGPWPMHRGSSQVNPTTALARRLLASCSWTKNRYSTAILTLTRPTAPRTTGAYGRARTGPVPSGPVPHASTYCAVLYLRSTSLQYSTYTCHGGASRSIIHHTVDNPASSAQLG